MAQRRDVERSGKMTVLAKVDRAVSVLARAGQLTPAEIADELGEPRSSTYRLLGSLEHLGWVEKGSSSHGYRLGPRLISIGAATARHLDVRRVAIPVMQKLQSATGESIFLCFRREWRAVCVERLEGVGAQSPILQVGASLPLHTGAFGIALLAFEPVAVWHEYLANAPPPDPLPGSTPADVSTIIEVLDEARYRGVAIADGTVTAGIAGIGAPVLDYGGAVAASLTVSGLREQVLAPEAQTAGLVMEAAAEISAGLGYGAAEPAALPSS